jgi:hypothetical protein
MSAPGFGSSKLRMAVPFFPFRATCRSLNVFVGVIVAST